METKVLTQEEITQLKKIQQDRFSLIENYGLVEVQIQELKHVKEQLNTNLTDLKKIEEELGKQLQTKYGEGSIDLEKGMFIKS
jgi:stress response protein YsnF